MQIESNLFWNSLDLEKAYVEFSSNLVSLYEPIQEDRTGVPTFRSSLPLSFSFSLFHPLTKKLQLPLMLGRRTPLRGILAELVWFLRGSRSKKEISEDLNFPIWASWGKENSDDMGPVYGHQWRNWGGNKKRGGLDQWSKIMNELQRDPFSRRNLMITWNPKELGKQWVALPPCHGIVIQFNNLKTPQGKTVLNMIVYMRSTDILVGGVANIIMYSIIAHLVSKELGYLPGFVSFQMAIPHVYENQKEALGLWRESLFNNVNKQDSNHFITFGEKPFSLKSKDWNIENFFAKEESDPPDSYILKLSNYNSQPFIKIPVSV